MLGATTRELAMQDASLSGPGLLGRGRTKSLVRFCAGRLYGVQGHFAKKFLQHRRKIAAADDVAVSVIP